jgi:DNA polymerase/3'-5' exonuclease PolX
LSSGERIPLDEAQEIATRTVSLLRSACERIQIAGSIRRERPAIGDIEIVAVARYMKPEVIGLGLFDPDLEIARADGRLENELTTKLDTLLASHVIRRADPKGGRAAAWGPKHKQFGFEGREIDLYIVEPPAQWGVILAIRTGSAWFSKQLVTRKSAGGYLPNHLRVKDGALRSRSTDEIIPTAQEGHFFAEIGLDYIRPPLREEAGLA